MCERLHAKKCTARAGLAMAMTALEASASFDSKIIKVEDAQIENTKRLSKGG